MAIVKANFVKRNKQERAGAKDNIRYIQHRAGKDGQKITRQLFGIDGAMERQEAYQMIDEAEKGSIFFRFVITPDPKEEDKRQDLNMRELTERTMQKLQEKMQKPIQWVGAVHSDHRPHRHIHILAIVPDKLYTQDFQNMRDQATAVCLEQRKELDRGGEQKQRKQEQELELSL